MLDFSNADNVEKLEARISELLVELQSLTGNTEEYTATAKNLSTLMELRNQILKTANDTTKIANDFSTEQEKIRIEEAKLAADREKLNTWKPSADAVVSAAAGIVGILAVLHYEKVGVVTSKAFGFIGKMK